MSLTPEKVEEVDNSEKKNTEKIPEIDHLELCLFNKLHGGNLDDYVRYRACVDQFEKDEQSGRELMKKRVAVKVDKDEKA